MYFKLSFIIYNKKEKKIKVIIKLIRKSISIAMRLNPNWIILFNSRKNNGAIKSTTAAKSWIIASIVSGPFVNTKAFRQELASKG